jgi:hypothetical protein
MKYKVKNFTQSELRDIRHLINIQEVNYQKLINYADYSVDPQIKQTFNKAAQDALNAKSKLVSFLNS